MDPSSPGVPLASGGDSRAVQDQLKNVQHIQASSNGAFAAILADGSVVTWGAPEHGGDSSTVQDQLKKCAAYPSLMWCFCCHSRRWIRRHLGLRWLWR